MEQAGIFDDLVSQPLAARLRPETIEEYVGQEHLLGRGRVLRRMIEQDRISSMISSTFTSFFSNSLISVPSNFSRISSSPLIFIQP